MIRLPAFTYLAPETIDGAVRAMADAGPDSMLVAGGTDLYPNMKRRQFEPKVLVGLRGIRELAGIRGWTLTTAVERTTTNFDALFGRKPASAR